jgi:hypothetical protein
MGIAIPFHGSNPQTKRGLYLFLNNATFKMMLEKNSWLLETFHEYEHWDFFFFFFFFFIKKKR